MLNILTTDYPLIQQLRLVAHALDVVSYTYRRVLPDDTLAEMRKARVEIIAHIEEWENTSL